jgi:hypothetical protein
MTATGGGWRDVHGTPTAWFATPSLSAGADLATRVLDLVPDAAVDLHTAGTRVRLSSPEAAPLVSGAARGLGLSPASSATQLLSVVVESPAPAAVVPFWQGALGYPPARDGPLTDQLHREPTFRIRPSAEARPLRNRIHVDVVRPPATIDRTGLGAPYGPYGVCQADADGNEVDLVPGDPLGDAPEVSDWQVVFAAMACYRTASPAQQRDLATAAATLADDADFPLRIDLRPGLVILDTGKDRWHPGAHGLDLDFADLAARLQAAAREAGAVADPTLPRLVQLVIDAADVLAIRAFWAAALGYVPDRRPDVTDLVDPRDLGPVLLFQGIDLDDAERRRQRNRMHLELAVPPDAGPARVATAVAAGGRLLDEATNTRRIADPEGNELVILGT